LGKSLKGLPAESKIMKKQLSKSDIKQLNIELKEKYGFPDFFRPKDNIEVWEDDGFKFIVQDGEKIFFYKQTHLVPTLRLLLKNNFLKKVTVDMGAVKHVASGADIMRPGIVSVDDNIEAHDIVAVVDQTHQKPLAIGHALFSSEEIRQMEKGKAVETFHFVGDKIWS